ncbi:Aste57867_15574 [Aphanomyces stellatus]|uniref:Aste57867_15574 protein n=1 Tax=Aphanomyces stellatus TaxID=120398 RepID=A0A485L3G0_9STRA|nr:hypothetical protein As57867_015518 [Aphanomyces stellatus]VFT92376.1 Aste57867_15574 [Aphanomyces stellatus]
MQLKPLIGPLTHSKRWVRDCHLTMDWYTWQLVDSLYPTGGFAHSLGLESAVQEKLVTNSVTLRKFLVSSLHQTANLLLPLLYAAHGAPTVENFLHLDATTHAMLTNHVAARASIAQGTAMLRVASTCLPDHTTVLQEIKRRKVHGHHVVVLGVVCGALGMDAMAAQRLLLFMTLRDTLSAATRLNVVGPLESARLQTQLAPLAEDILQSKKDRPVSDAYQSAPFLDLVQARHDQLYTRIFNS